MASFVYILLCKEAFVITWLPAVYISIYTGFLSQSLLGQTNIYMCVSNFSSEKARYGRSALSYIYIQNAFFTVFSTNSKHIWQYFAHNSQ